jgi:hypothetical protein
LSSKSKNSKIVQQRQYFVSLETTLVAYILSVFYGDKQIKVDKYILNISGENDNIGKKTRPFTEK